MKKIYTLVALMIFIAGCADKEPEFTLDPVLEAPEITLFKQSLPIEHAVLEKAYKKISPEVALSNLEDLQGKSFDEEFVFDAQNLPFVEYHFDKPYIIKKVHLLNSGFIIAGDSSSSHIKKFEIVFFNTNKSLIYSSELDTDDKEIEALHNVVATGFILKTHSVYVPDGTSAYEVKAAFDTRIEVEVIDVNHIYDIIAPVLSHRESSNSNEELLKTIALLNTELFKRLKAMRKDFKLPKNSVLYLPDDADMDYAVSHTQEIYQTGKYKTIDGEYKIHIFNEKAEFDAKGNIRVNKHEIKINKSNRNLKTTTQLPDHEDFIDFSEGL
ncbi:hypothetical protein JHD50_11755 [Sulfurimonas sp. MAG313]|nr:hypothetical protein [Sulfurimonas sp. MAG313]MDF1881963.1 hypothetical protein [Sulfurimonas sp. MAG313]